MDRRAVAEAVHMLSDRLEAGQLVEDLQVQSAAVAEAVQWLADRTEQPSAVEALRTFGQACEDTAGQLQSVYRALAHLAALADDTAAVLQTEAGSG